jgi:hypothetical protein
LQSATSFLRKFQSFRNDEGQLIKYLCPGTEIGQQFKIMKKSETGNTKMREKRRQHGQKGVKRVALLIQQK